MSPALYLFVAVLIVFFHREEKFADLVCKNFSFVVVFKFKDFDVENSKDKLKNEKLM